MDNAVNEISDIIEQSILMRHYAIGQFRLSKQVKPYILSLEIIDGLELYHETIIQDFADDFSSAAFLVGETFYPPQKKPDPMEDMAYSGECEGDFTVSLRKNYIKIKTSKDKFGPYATHDFLKAYALMLNPSHEIK